MCKTLKEAAMFYIVLSEKQTFREGAELILNAGSRQGKAMKIITTNEVIGHEMAEPDEVFFLTNEESVGDMVRDLISDDVKVLNGEYITGTRSKSETQEILSNMGVLVPKIYLKSSEYEEDSDKIAELKFPVYIKSENHVCDVIKVNDSESFVAAFKEDDEPYGWYAEEAVDGPERSLRKVYWVSDKAYARDAEETLSEDVQQMLQVIGGKFSFDTFSADLIMGHGKVWCIDVNPAPALFGSVSARERFAERLCS